MAVSDRAGGRPVRLAVKSSSGSRNADSMSWAARKSDCRRDPNLAFSHGGRCARLGPSMRAGHWAKQGWRLSAHHHRQSRTANKVHLIIGQDYGQAEQTFNSPRPNPEQKAHGDDLCSTLNPYALPMDSLRPNLGGNRRNRRSKVRLRGNPIAQLPRVCNPWQTAINGRG